MFTGGRANPTIDLGGGDRLPSRAVATRGARAGDDVAPIPHFATLMRAPCYLEQGICKSRL